MPGLAGRSQDNWDAKKVTGGEERSRERVLSPEEIRIVWFALDAPSTKMSPAIRIVLKLILATAQRGGEFANARLDQVDLIGRIWAIPDDVAKNQKKHLVPLTNLAVDLFPSLRIATEPRSNRKTKQVRPRGPFLLPTAHVDDKPDQPISERALSRALKNNHTKSKENPKLFGLEPFTPHDLRRSASTLMTSLGIPRLHVSKGINHTSEEDEEAPPITGVYDRYDYWREEVRALSALEAGLRATLAGGSDSLMNLAAIATVSVARTTEEADATPYADTGVKALRHLQQNVGSSGAFRRGDVVPSALTDQLFTLIALHEMGRLSEGMA